MLSSIGLYCKSQEKESYLVLFSLDKKLILLKKKKKDFPKPSWTMAKSLMIYNFIVILLVKILINRSNRDIKINDPLTDRTILAPTEL